MMTFVRAVVAPLSSDLDEFGQQKLRAAGRLPLPFPRGPPRYMYSAARMMNHRCIASMVGQLESVLACIFLIRYLVDTPPPLLMVGPLPGWTARWWSFLLCRVPEHRLQVQARECEPAAVRHQPVALPPRLGEKWRKAVFR